jgi:hypothetical protein
MEKGAVEQAKADAREVFDEVFGVDEVEYRLRTGASIKSALELAHGRDLAAPTGGPLEFQGSNDYTFPEGGETSFWVTVGTISVWVRRHEGGVIVELMRHHDEAEGDLLGSCEATF